MAASLRALGGRFLSTFTAAAGASPEDSDINDEEGLELQVQEKEDVEMDVLNLKGREVAVGKDQGHIIDLGVPEAKEGRNRRSAQGPKGAFFAYIMTGLQQRTFSGYQCCSRPLLTDVSRVLPGHPCTCCCLLVLTSVLVKYCL